MRFKLESGLILIFGASGDLVQRKLVPAIFGLYLKNNINKYIVLGVARSDFTNEYFRAKITDNLLEHHPNLEGKINNFSKLFFYHRMDPTNEKDYVILYNKLQKIKNSYELGGNILFYLSTPPHLLYYIPLYLANLGLNNQKDGYKRLVIEKPFGIDEKSANELNLLLLRHYEEKQIFRIDHYLGKDMIQNILFFRFANSVFEPLWNNKYIDNIQIYSNESIGLGSRSGYYDGSGAIKDMIQNHLLQVLGVIAMDDPELSINSSIRNELLKVFNSIHRFQGTQFSDSIVVGQYKSGVVEGKKLVAYRDEKGVHPESYTETYAAIRFFINNMRWKNVPFYVRTGKRLRNKVSEIVVNFKQILPSKFLTQIPEKRVQNQLIINLYPSESIKIKFFIKESDTNLQVRKVDMSYDHALSDCKNKFKEYERLILNALQGDTTLFVRNDSVESCWNIIDPITDFIKKNRINILNFYSSGSDGPEKANHLLKKMGHKWYNL